MAALKVLRGDHKKEAAVTSGLAQQIVVAVSSQKEVSSSQTAEIIDAVKEQTTVLHELTELFQTKQTATVIVVNKDNTKGEVSSSSVASTAAETEMSILTDYDDASVAAVKTSAEQASASTTEPAVAAPETTTEPATVPVAGCVRVGNILPSLA
jgi:RNase H-fold protein (predicted Holliday junction resolvase)